MTLSDRMKLYEQAEAGRRALPLLPICARIDGRNFHGWTRGLARPFDARLHALMVDTTRRLVQESAARIGYTQSDEITLVLYSGDLRSQVFFDGKLQKLASVLASLATAHFNAHVPALLAEKAGHPACFDARVWTVPTREEAANVLLWREQDATRNSIESAARAVASDRECHGLHAGQLQELCFQRGVNWNDYPAALKRGTYVRRVKRERTLTTEERERIPERFRPEAVALVQRTTVESMAMPIFAEVANRVAVVFEGADPVHASMLELA